jgi:hypothetical protein
MGETLLLLSCGAAFVTGLVYRGGDPICITEGAIAPGPSQTGRGRSLKGAEDNLNRIFRDGHHIGQSRFSACFPSVNAPGLSGEMKGRSS